MANNVRIMKLEGKYLEENKFNVKLNWKDAEKMAYTIQLGVNQVLDWVYESRGTTYAEVNEEVSRLKGLKTREAKEQINKLINIDEIIQVVIEGKARFDKIMKGFKVNGYNYKYLLSKGEATITFVREDLYELFTTRLNASRNESVKMFSAKLQAYRALAFSTSQVVSSPKKVVVLPDCNVTFMAEYLWVDEDVEHRNEEVERCINDGCFFISPELAKVWSAELNHPEKVIGAFQVRFLWTKGICYTVDYHTWCKEHDCEYVTDLWNEKHRIEDVDLILGESMVKLWGSYNSCEHWLECAKEHHYSFRVGNFSKPIKQNRLNYQELLPLELSWEDCRELLEPNIQHLKDISSNDYVSTCLYLNGENGLGNDLTSLTMSQALLIEPRMINDMFICNSITRMTQKARNDLKIGEIMIDPLSSYQIIVSDPIQLLQHLIGVKNPRGILKRYEVYSANHEEGTVATASRAPLLTANNLIKIRTRKDMGAYNKYFEYLDDVYAVDGVSLINESLCGFDLDGDKIQLISTDVIVRNTKDLLPIKCAGINGDKVVCTEQELIKSARACCGNSIPNIGSEINKASSFFCIMSRYAEGTQQRLEMERRLLQAVKITQSVIDAKKSSKFFSYPKEWLNSKAIEELEDGEYKDLCKELVADKKPYFMMHRYDETKKDYKEQYELANVKSLINFGCTFDELLNKEDRTEDEQRLVDIFKQHIPVNIDDDTMYRVSKVAEEMVKEVVCHDRTKDTKELIKSYVEVDEDIQEEIDRLYNKMNREIRQAQAIKTNGCYTSKEASILKQQLSNSIKDEYLIKMLEVANGNREICMNALIECAYDSNRSASLVWDNFGDIILNNLLARHNGYVNVIEEDVNGEHLYKGKRYSLKKVELKK